MEMQSILFTLLESFEFTFPTTPSKTGNTEGKTTYDYELRRVPTGLMLPAVKGKAPEPSVPLKVKVRAA
jgi:hypothetical protein